MGVGGVLPLMLRKRAAHILFKRVKCSNAKGTAALQDAQADMDGETECGGRKRTEGTL